MSESITFHRTRRFLGEALFVAALVLVGIPALIFLLIAAVVARRKKQVKSITYQDGEQRRL